MHIRALAHTHTHRVQSTDPTDRLKYVDTNTITYSLKRSIKSGQRSESTTGWMCGSFSSVK